MNATHDAALLEKQKMIQELEDSMDEMEQEAVAQRLETEETTQVLRSSLDSLRAYYDEATSKNHELQQESVKASHMHSLEVQQLNAQLSQQAIITAELQATVDSSRDEHDRAMRILREEMDILRSDNAQLSSSIQTLHSLEKQREQDPNSQTVRSGSG